MFEAHYEAQHAVHPDEGAAGGAFPPAGAPKVRDGGGDRDVRRIALGTPLPCAIPECRARASVGVAEPAPDFPGLWLLFPLCGDHTGASS